MPVIPSVEVTAPAMSKCPLRRGVSCRAMRPTSSTAMPIGTFTNITQRHETSSVSTPPATRPIAPPAAETVVNRPMARTRWGPSEKMVVRSASEDGAASAAPTPCRARAARSIQPSAAKPPTSELTVNTAMPSRKVRRRPSRSPARAPRSRSAAEGEQVGVEHPGELAPGEAEALLDVGQGDVDDGGVEDDHELGREDDEQEHRRAGEQGLETSGRPEGGTADGRDR